MGLSLDCAKRSGDESLTLWAVGCLTKIHYHNGSRYPCVRVDWPSIFNGLVHPLKLVQIKNPFGFLQSSPQILVERVEPFFVVEKHVFVRHPIDDPSEDLCWRPYLMTRLAWFLKTWGFKDDKYDIPMCQSHFWNGNAIFNSRSRDPKSRSSPLPHSTLIWW